MTSPTENGDASQNSDTSSGDERTVLEERKLTGMRRTIANRLQESSQEAAHVTASREVDAEELVRAAEVASDKYDVDVSVVDIVLCALSETLADHPAFNATLEDGLHRLYETQNVGIAVDIDAGLVTPVLTALESKSLDQVAIERRELTESVQTGSYSMSDLRGGTFTITNLGVLGIDSFTPIINPPEVAILGVNRIRDRARPGDEGVDFRKQIQFDLSFDHRVVDGADAARFLETLATHIENAEALL
ncbi:dihydrolipoamide S-acyltransferase (plasmid) [Natrialba magadii ATCC 43099]|uniref:Dihydrolipoamide S-acyltransferase n=1 Tax=Natrialba magadii (strain ATCC 43099 / DSM 3394 / CCM 3739 / CIP 104546 / IAM 13178 / JCM 8861 / NBRC 102185 / NCIMB 2190 / MS3) TaxID=547559 RepID=D3T1V2_NATMM|nr:2-oxo acid dehydrogenase subunit E2 [Natrialba magadii]ADD07561.1 dihydrolipoamide S-acyltransferase [Natrialba magadii ATCC 43099]ELY27202.1 Dihydrolipoyllysine-residue acetyltransferase [Natrialba magadii ATCC 43099]